MQNGTIHIALYNKPNVHQPVVNKSMGRVLLEKLIVELKKF
jgi:hypothetical protein